MHQIHRFFQLTRPEKVIFFRALQLLVYFRLSLKYRPLPKIFSEVEKKSNTAAPQSQPALPLLRISHLITVCSRYIPYSTCFSKALAGKVIFSEIGYSVDLHIGVNKTEDSAFAAHAWLSFENKVVLCNLIDLSSYKEMPLQKYRSFR